MSRVFPEDSITAINLAFTLPWSVLAVASDIVAGELIGADFTIVSERVGSKLNVSCYGTHPVEGEGELFALRLTAKPGAPDGVVHGVSISKVLQDAIPLDYLPGSKRPGEVRNGAVRIRNLNLVPAAISVSSDTAAITGTRISLGVIASGLLSADGLTSLNFSVSLPPELLSEFTVRPGLFPAGAITISGQSANVLLVSGAVANPETGVDTLFTIDGLVRQSIPDGTMYAVAIEHLIESGNPLPIVLKGGQSPECTVENGVIKVRSSSSVVSDRVRTPSRAELLAYPNPFNSAVTFRLVGYEQSGSARATLYTALGTVVRSWTVAGPEWIWDGRDQQGAKAASGVYFLVVNSHTENYRKRVTLLR